MSEKRSWDIQPRKQVAQQPAPTAPAAQPRVQRLQQPIRSAQRPQSQQRPETIEPMVRRSALKKKQNKQSAAEPEPIKPMTVRREHVPQGRARESLKVQRKRARRRGRVIGLLLIVILLVAVVLALWLPAVRIQNVQAAGPDQQGIQSIALRSITGTDYYLFPRDSIFFFPAAQIRQQVLAAYPDVSAVSISRTSLSTISVAGIARESAFIWCGESYTSYVAQTVQAVSQATSSTSSSSTATSTTADASTPTALDSSASTCYNADGQGFIFSAATSAASDTFRIYGAFMSPGAQPIGSKMANANSIPVALSFVKALRSMNVPVTSLVIRGDEADLYTPAGTRITYVLGKEQGAEQLAQAAFKDLNLNDGSLQYVDLRFDGKVYYKKVGSNTESDTSE